MPFGDAAANARRAALWTRYLDDAATVLRPSYTVGTGGGRPVTWGTVTQNGASTVAARWQPNRFRATETPTAEAVWAIGPIDVQVPAGTDVQEQDRLRQESTGALYEVQGTSGPRSYEYGLTVAVVSIHA